MPVLITVLRLRQTQGAFAERIFEAELTLFSSFWHWEHYIVLKCLTVLITHLCSPHRLGNQNIHSIHQNDYKFWWVQSSTGKRIISDKSMTISHDTVPTFLKSKIQHCNLTPCPKHLALPISILSLGHSPITGLCVPPATKIVSNSSFIVLLSGTFPL